MEMCIKSEKINWSFMNSLIHILIIILQIFHNIWKQKQIKNNNMKIKVKQVLQILENVKFRVFIS